MNISFPSLVNLGLGAQGSLTELWKEKLKFIRWKN